MKLKMLFATAALFVSVALSAQTKTAPAPAPTKAVKAEQSTPAKKDMIEVKKDENQAKPACCAAEKAEGKACCAEGEKGKGKGKKADHKHGQAATAPKATPSTPAPTEK